MATLHLKELLEDVEVVETKGDLTIPIEDIVYDSRRVEQGSLFVAVRGLKTDGHDYISEALKRGCRVAIVEKEDKRIETQVIVKNSRRALSIASRNFFGDPSEKLELIGVTGTNGKTTTTYLIESILRNSGLKTGLIGTVEYRIGDKSFIQERTTPESYDLQKILFEMVKHGISHVAMEVSSHAIDLNRITGCRFACKVFTNLSQDHLDYHGTIEEYFAAKKSFFEDGQGCAVINTDDLFGRRIQDLAITQKTYGIDDQADLQAKDITLKSNGSSFMLTAGSESIKIDLKLVGLFNVYNALAAAAACQIGKISLDNIKKGLESVENVSGRFERIDYGQDFSVYVDYAHTPESLKQVLETSRSVTPGKLIVVFGCGGDRDRQKRPLMGKIAGELSDKAIITSDNPRTEEPESIIRQIEQGIKKTKADYIKVTDRKEAIKTALEQAEKDDAVIIAGKGHETTQTFKDKTIHFDDREVAGDILMELVAA